MHIPLVGCSPRYHNNAILYCIFSFVTSFYRWFWPVTHTCNTTAILRPICTRFGPIPNHLDRAQTRSSTKIGFNHYCQSHILSKWIDTRFKDAEILASTDCVRQPDNTCNIHQLNKVNKLTNNHMSLILMLE